MEPGYHVERANKLDRYEFARFMRVPSVYVGTFTLVSGTFYQKIRLKYDFKKQASVRRDGVFKENIT